MKSVMKVDFRNPPTLASLEGQLIMGVLAVNGWSISDAAAALGVNRRTIQRFLYPPKRRRVVRRVRR